MGTNHKLPLSHYMNVEIADDRLSAQLQFINDEDEFSCTANDLEQFLNQHGVKFGIHMEKLAAIAKETQKYVFSQVTVATGKIPQDGMDGYIKFMFDLDAERKPALLEDGKVNYKEVLNLNNVRKGQLIAERILATEGTEGKSVTGAPVFGKKGKDVRFKLGKNVVCDGEQRLLYAAIDGLITKTDRDKINVFPVYEVNGDVDYNIGNIEFVGTVVVRGNVLSGFRIRASGDIRIVGGVEGAELFAEGSIEITAGVLGHNKGIVKAKKNVKASFVQDGNIEAGEDIIVSQSIMHSQIRAGRNVLCQGNKGLIVGGMIQAGEQVKARVIGNTTSTVTVIEVGVLPELRNEHVELRAKVKELADNIDKTEKALALLDQLALVGQLGPDKMAMRTRLTTTKRQLLEAISETRERILEIEKSLEDTSAAKVETLNMMYSGCKIVIGRYTRFIKDPTQRATFRLVDGEIALTST